MTAALDRILYWRRNLLFAYWARRFPERDCHGNGSRSGRAIRPNRRRKVKARILDSSGNVIAAGEPWALPQAAGTYTWTVGVFATSSPTASSCLVQGIDPRYPYDVPQLRKVGQVAAQTSNSERLITDGDTCLTLSPLELAQAGQPVEVVGAGPHQPPSLARGTVKSTRSPRTGDR